VDWTAFAAGLAEELADLPVGTLVVIREADREIGRARFAQFVQEDDGLAAEVVTNDALESEFRASSAGEEVIRQAGWHDPAPLEGYDVWWYTLPWPASGTQYRELSLMVVTAVRYGYGIDDTTPWCYRAWNERKGNEPVELPGLGLPCEQ
jgi:hypothetical protein